MFSKDYNNMKKKKDISAGKIPVEKYVYEKPVVEQPVIEEPILPIKKMTVEQVKKSISTAYSSVKIIKELQSKLSLKEDEQVRLDSNKKHIELMLTKDWFLEELLEEQKVELESVIQ